MQTDYGVFFEETFFHVLETISEDNTGDKDSVIIHFRQAMLQAVQDLQPCFRCTASVTVFLLKTKAKELQERVYTSFPEMTLAFDSLLADFDCLCASCKAMMKETILKHFYTLHHHG